MAAKKNSANLVANKNKGMKDHNKEQKDKALTKRTSAAKKAKAKNTSSAHVVAAVVKRAVPVRLKTTDDVDSPPAEKTGTRTVTKYQLPQAELHFVNIIADEPVTIAASKDVAIPRDEITAELNTVSQMKGTDGKCLIEDGHSGSHPSTVIVEEFAIGLADNIPTKVDITDRIKDEHQVEGFQLSRYMMHSTNNITEISTLNPTAKRFHFTKTKVARNILQDTTLRNEASTSNELTTNMMAHEQPFGIVAHRRALEVELYDNMETPRQMLMRCKYIMSIDAEYHPKDEDESFELKELRPTVMCLDDNLFEIEPIMTGLTGNDMMACTKIAPEFLDTAIVRYKINGREFDNTGSLAITNDLSANHHTETPDTRASCLDLMMVSPLDRSPTCSHQSRVSSPADPARSQPPLTPYSVSPSSRMPVWTVPHNLPNYIVSNNAVFHGPGVPINPYGGFDNPPAQQYAHHQHMRAVYYVNWSASGSWALFPVHRASKYTQ
jgi:hypothetical protein